eukprot:Gregarina_sp_Poly_1__10456@NODE_75_length_15886_cov_79_326569_g64_i0_p3_GENE_NODE_75_length_15886_cov_79_326569_g64_i0NODE_75_length_15886_cov_79_326569_g64_i0_p3_ORF_typecomplete_len323_score51_15_NODE_75_length_15886_cov_79_326569_g64_i01452215490
MSAPTPMIASQFRAHSSENGSESKTGSKSADRCVRSRSLSPSRMALMSNDTLSPIAGYPSVSPFSPSHSLASEDWRQQWIRSGRRIRRRTQQRFDVLKELIGDATESEEGLAPSVVSALSVQSPSPRHGSTISDSLENTTLDSEDKCSLSTFISRRRRVRNPSGLKPLDETIRNLAIGRDLTSTSSLASLRKQKIRGFEEVWEKGPNGGYEIHLKRLPGCAAVEMPYTTSPVACPPIGVFSERKCVRPSRRDHHEAQFNINPAYDTQPLPKLTCKAIKGLNSERRLNEKMMSLQEQREKLFGTTAITQVGFCSSLDLCCTLV